MRRRFDLYARNIKLTLGHETKIMGVINCTPDSFSGDGRLKSAKGKIDPSACLRVARKLIREGADILDIGGESTRPGALSISPQEEMKRILPVIEALVRRVSIPISVDTSKLEVARCALDAGVSMVNNIQGNQLSNSFLKMVRDYKASIVVMHMRGTPASMQSKAHYTNIVNEVIEELQISIEKCLAIGIKKDRIIVDPGIGFAKRAEHNLTLLKHLNRLNVLGFPILLGSSRKSFIGHLLGKDEGHRLMGTAATVTAGVLQGAHIVRVHDINKIKETLKVTDAILNAHP